MLPFITFSSLFLFSSKVKSKIWLDLNLGLVGCTNTTINCFWPYHNLYFIIYRSDNTKNKNKNNKKTNKQTKKKGNKEKIQEELENINLYWLKQGIIHTCLFIICYSCICSLKSFNEFSVAAACSLCKSKIPNYARELLYFVLYMHSDRGDVGMHVLWVVPLIAFEHAAQLVLG